jgi:hypothetical protein
VADLAIGPMWSEESRPQCGVNGEREKKNITIMSFRARLRKVAAHNPASFLRSSGFIPLPAK